MVVPTSVGDKENTNKLDMTVAENKVQEHVRTFMKQSLEETICLVYNRWARRENP